MGFLNKLKNAVTDGQTDSRIDSIEVGHDGEMEQIESVDDLPENEQAIAQWLNEIGQRYGADEIGLESDGSGNVSVNMVFYEGTIPRKLDI